MTIPLISFTWCFSAFGFDNSCFYCFSEISCPQLDVTDGTILSRQVAFYAGDEVDIDCELGTQLATASPLFASDITYRMRCENNGQWFPAELPSCERKCSAQITLNAHGLTVLGNCDCDDKAFDFFHYYQKGQALRNTWHVVPQVIPMQKITCKLQKYTINNNVDTSYGTHHIAIRTAFHLYWCVKPQMWQSHSVTTKSSFVHTMWIGMQKLC